MNWKEKRKGKRKTAAKRLSSTYALNEAGISLRDPDRIVFVRLGKVTPQDKFELSFEDEPPPWLFDIKFNFSRKDIDSTLMKKAEGKIKRKVESMRCSKHGHAAHIEITGPGPENLTINIEACCKEFADAAMEKAESRS